MFLVVAITKCENLGSCCSKRLVFQGSSVAYKLPIYNLSKNEKFDYFWLISGVFLN